MTSMLAEFGLTKNEIEIFVILVQSGVQSATEIATRTGLNRPYVYYALERLLEKGFISQVKRQDKRVFQHIPLHAILSTQEIKLESLRMEMEELAKRRKPEPITVEVLKGKFVIRAIIRRYRDFAQPGGEVLSVGIQEEIMEASEPIDVKKAVAYNVENKISERIITRPGARQLEYAYTSRYRFLAKQYLNQTAKIIFKEHVVELFYQNPVYAIIIHSRTYAETARNQFEILWERSAGG